MRAAAKSSSDYLCLPLTVRWGGVSFTLERSSPKMPCCIGLEQRPHPTLIARNLSQCMAHTVI
jgi:hypothetical protein